MWILSFEKRQQQFRLVCHINICVTVSIPITVFVAIYIFAARHIQIDDSLALHFHDLRREIGTGQEQFLVVDTVDDVDFERFRSIWINSYNGAIIQNAQKDMPSCMVKE